MKNLKMILSKNFIAVYYRDKNDRNGNPVYRYNIFKTFQEIGQVRDSLETGKSKSYNIKEDLQHILNTYEEIKESKGE